ncbi:hypothetical protein B0H34DRAFT_716852 [Crassisporium funariophilum]|nr:hypothetical protein B0H34DRAFT_716852 [Crassisporium funariophilum]
MVSWKFLSRGKAASSSKPSIKPQDGAASTSASAKQQDGAAKASSKPQGNAPAGALKDSSMIDVLFVQDTTGSQQPYIASARTAIRGICKKISVATKISPECIRFGLIAFRDHPPQDMTYVTKDFGFSSDLSVMEKNLSGLVAAGGGDGPEAVTAALALALNMEWKEAATKMVILITDAPPHGIGEVGDGFDSSPDQNDPLDIARQMAERGIALFVVACEPELSDYRNAVDFYTALTEITSGKMFPLTMANRLGDYIAGTAVETVETENLIKEYEEEILHNVYAQSKPIEEVMDDIHGRLTRRGVQMNTLAVENVYNASQKAVRNVQTWQTSSKIVDARARVEQINEPRMQEEYSSRSKAPKVDLEYKAAGYSSAKRVVMKSVMRGSNVTATGMTAKSGSSFGLKK